MIDDDDTEWQRVNEEAIRLRPPWITRRWWIWVACIAEVIDGLIGVALLGFVRGSLQARLVYWRWRAYGYAIRPPHPAEKA